MVLQVGDGINPMNKLFLNDFWRQGDQSSGELLDVEGGLSHSSSFAPKVFLWSCRLEIFSDIAARRWIFDRHARNSSGDIVTNQFGSYEADLPNTAHATDKDFVSTNPRAGVQPINVPGHELDIGRIHSTVP